MCVNELLFLTWKSRPVFWRRGHVTTCVTQAPKNVFTFILYVDTVPLIRTGCVVNNGEVKEFRNGEIQ